MNTDDGGGRSLAPDDAFAALGDETRLSILQALGAADGPLAFSELRERVGTRDSSRFNYHLDKLRGHFVEQSDDGYELRRAGRRVVEAVLSGAVTEEPDMERQEIAAPCHQCGAPIEVTYRGDSVAVYCTDCQGSYSRSDPDDQEYGFLGYLALPPAGLEGRSAEDIHAAARTWQLSEILPAASGVCPRCAAALARSVKICEDHDADDGLCPDCGGRYAVLHDVTCTNCIYDQTGAGLLALLSHTALLSFLTDHGINPVAASSGRFSAAVMDYEETVHSTDPLEASFTVSADGDELTLRVDESLDVVAVE